VYFTVDRNVRVTRHTEDHFRHVLSCEGERWERNEGSLVDSNVEHEHRWIRHCGVLTGNISRHVLAHSDAAANIEMALSVNR